MVVCEDFTCIVNVIITFNLPGTYAGNIIGFPLSGLLCNTMGWPWSFYLSGRQTCITCSDP